MIENYISESSDALYEKIDTYKGIITKEEAIEDLGKVKYLIRNRYCGMEYWERNGIDFDNCFSQIEKFIIGENEIYISDYCREIHKAFNVGIVDNHLSFCSPYTGRLGFGNNYTAYFADLRVQKKAGKHVVVWSKEDNVSVGDILEGVTFYNTIPLSGVETFLVGCRSVSPLQSMEIIVNGNKVNISLHTCRAGKTTDNRAICMEEKELNGITVLRSNCCDYVGNITEQTDFVSMGKAYHDTKKLVLNYLSNEGGYNRITREFIYGLNDYVHCEEHSVKLISPVTEMKDCKREWITLSEIQPYKRELGTYDGTLYLLVNRDTGSAGETAVLYGRSLRNIVLVGENTMGCNTFGNVNAFVLPYSKIICRVPNVINLCGNPEECVEGHGFDPDYWVDSEDVEGEVIKWLSE